MLVVCLILYVLIVNALTTVNFRFLKDFRAMLHLCEAQKASVALRFEQAGSPLVVGPHIQQGDGPVRPDRRFSQRFNTMSMCIVRICCGWPLGVWPHQARVTPS